MLDTLTADMIDMEADKHDFFVSLLSEESDWDEEEYSVDFDDYSM